MLECIIRVPVARQPTLTWKPFCAPLIEGSSSCYLPSMNLIRPPSTELLQFLTGYVTLRCDLDLWPFDLGVMPLWCSNRVPSLNWIRFTVPDLGQLQFSIYRQLKVPIFTFFGRKGGSNFKFNLSNPQNTLPWRKRRIMAYWALGFFKKNATCGCVKERKKRTKTFMRQTGYLPRPHTST